MALHVFFCFAFAYLLSYLLRTGNAVMAPFLRADLVDEAMLLHGPRDIGRDGIDALDGLPLEALTASPHLRRTGTDTVGDDRIEQYEWH